MNPEPTPADTLRRAATMVRELATAATPGPWSHGVYHNERAVLRTEDTTWVARCGTTALPEPEADAAHIAAWSPPVALAVADWLDVTARDVGTSTLAYHAALAVARALLGEDS